METEILGSDVDSRVAVSDESTPGFFRLIAADSNEGRITLTDGLVSKGPYTVIEAEFQQKGGA